MRGVPVKKALPISSLIIICILAMTAATRAPGHDPSGRNPLPTKHIRYSFTLHNTTNRMLRQVDFWTYAPVKENALQKCMNLETSHPCQVVADNMGNQVLHFSLPVPPYATIVLTISAELSFVEESRPMPVGDLQPYLLSEKFIEWDNPDIRCQAAILKQTTPGETAERIFQWVAEHIKDYAYFPEDHGAVFAFRYRRGDCSEAMYLFIALCRANGIPARGIGGYVVGKNALLDPNAYHNWGEFYTDGTWHMADPQRKVFVQSRSRYLAMRIIGRTSGNPMGDHNRFRCSGEGMEVRMNRPSGA